MKINGKRQKGLFEHIQRVNPEELLKKTMETRSTRQLGEEMEKHKNKTKLYNKWIKNTRDTFNATL